MGYGVYGKFGQDHIDKDGKLVPAPGFHLSCVHTDFNCPWCEYEYGEDFYDTQLQKSKRGFIYKNCKICKKKIGITFGMFGDVLVWLKEKEKK